MSQVQRAQITISAALILAIALMLTILATRAHAADQADINACSEYLQDREVAETAEQKADFQRCLKQRAQKAAFRPWQRIWQCNDIRVTETVTQPGIINYDLGGTIWGGSQFTLMLQRGDLYFNGRPCLPLQW